MIDIIQYTDEDYEKHLTGFFFFFCTTGYLDV